ncbi:MAG: diaminopimelate epimerase [Deltaproteobacteria bacterium RIFOXYA12_FULL_61_11]|nr:MAG: diaminopimelate epimerase [Deltaproteobacteria bacterium RIFOXYA12_FULL_61_11]
MSFTKVHSAGNDFIIPEDLAVPEEDLPAVARFLCRRKVGIGSDGLILYSVSGREALRFRFFNPDGSEAEICGNGVISLATYLHRVAGVAGRRLRLETKAGVRWVLLKGEEVFVNLGKPRFALESVAEELLDREMAVGDRQLRLNYVSLGNPHCTVFVDSVDLLDLMNDGRLIEDLPIFPDGVNVEFVQHLDQNNLVARFWERGAGITLASGSGASAAAVISIVHRRCESPVTVHTEIGKLQVYWRRGSAIVLRGKGEIVYRGTVELPAEWPD